MITIHFNKRNSRYELIVKGHADFAEAGKDILCSAVSILLYTLVEAIDETWLKTPPVVVLSPGDTLVRVEASATKSAEINGVFGVITAGFRLLSKNFSKNVIFFEGEG